MTKRQAVSQSVSHTAIEIVNTEKREAISSNAIRDNGINDSNNSIAVTMLNKLRDQLVILMLHEG